METSRYFHTSVALHIPTHTSRQSPKVLRCKVLRERQTRVFQLLCKPPQSPQQSRPERACQLLQPATKLKVRSVHCGVQPALWGRLCCVKSSSGRRQKRSENSRRDISAGLACPVLTFAIQALQTLSSMDAYYLCYLISVARWLCKDACLRHDLQL